MAITLGGQPLLRGETITQARRRLSRTSSKTSSKSGGGGGIRVLLRQYGLGDLAPMVDRWVRDGLTWPEIEAQLLDRSTKAGKVVDRLYPELRLREEAGRAPMSIAEIQAYRTNRAQLLRASGVPEGFFDSPEDATRDIVNDVSLAELRDRVGEYERFGAQIAAGAGGELDLFERAYGVKPTSFELAALVLNPDKALPALRRQFAAVGLDVQAGRAGYGDLSQQEAERLVDVGVSEEGAVAGFNALADSRELFDALPGFEGSEDKIGRSEQLAGVFEGNANARRRIEKRAKERAGVFSGGGGFASDREGFSGIGKAS